MTHLILPTGTIFSTVFNVANAALGAGILAYPYGFAQGGWLGALGVMIMIALLSGTGNYCLVRYCDEFCPGAASYQVLFPFLFFFPFSFFLFSFFFFLFPFSFFLFPFSFFLFLFFFFFLFPFLVLSSLFLITPQ